MAMAYELWRRRGERWRFGVVMRAAARGRRDRVSIKAANRQFMGHAESFSRCAQVHSPDVDRAVLFMKKTLHGETGRRPQLLLPASVEHNHPMTLLISARMHVCRYARVHVHLLHPSSNVSKPATSACGRFAPVDFPSNSPSGSHPS